MFLFHMTQKRFGENNNYDRNFGNYRDSRVQDGRQVQGISGSMQFYFADNPLLANLETSAKSKGL